MTHKDILLKIIKNYIYLTSYFFTIKQKIMAKTLSVLKLVTFGLAAALSQAAFANDGFTQAEADTIVKEDIASAQVMVEMCPAIVGQDDVLRTKLKDIASGYLVDLSDKSMTFEKLQSDTEYKSVLEEARKDAQSTDVAELKEVCEELLNL